MTSCFVMNATILIVAAQFAHFSGSTSNTFLNSSAQRLFDSPSVRSFQQKSEIPGVEGDEHPFDEDEAMSEGASGMPGDTTPGTRPDEGSP